MFLLLFLCFNAFSASQQLPRIASPANQRSSLKIGNQTVSIASVRSHKVLIEVYGSDHSFWGMTLLAKHSIRDAYIEKGLLKIVWRCPSLVGHVCTWYNLDDENILGKKS
jgi:hypothetical protein